MRLDQPAWYALHTRSRHEKQVSRLLSRGVLEVYLPLKRTWSTRKDRRAVMEIPALPGYLFVRCVLLPETRAFIKRASGVLHLVESGGGPAVIAPEQIASLRLALQRSFDPEGFTGARVGSRVRVVRGPLQGVEGTLLCSAGSRPRLLVAIDPVEHCISVEIDAADVEAVLAPPGRGLASAPPIERPRPRG
jgi:transcription termination/antitermination protein NusG